MLRSHSLRNDGCNSKTNWLIDTISEETTTCHMSMTETETTTREKNVNDSVTVNMFMQHSHFFASDPNDQFASALHQLTSEYTCRTNATQVQSMTMTSVSSVHDK